MKNRPKNYKPKAENVKKLQIFLSKYYERLGSRSEKQ